MARSVSQALTRATSSLSNSHLTRLLPSRNRSTRPEPPLIRYSFDAERDPYAERVAIRKLEDAVHRIIVKRSQPDWLPFRPGSSYWVPPKSKSRGFAQVIDRLANSVSVKDPAMAIASHRGWPSSESYFKGGALSTREVQVQLSAMVRSLSQALNKTTSSNPRLLPARQRSTFPETPVIYHGYKDPEAKKEGAVHRIIVKRSQPNWLPLRPGLSYWAPPKSNSSGSIPEDHFAKGEAGSTGSGQNAARSEGDQES